MEIRVVFCLIKIFIGTFVESTLAYVSTRNKVLWSEKWRSKENSSEQSVEFMHRALTIKTFSKLTFLFVQCLMKFLVKITQKSCQCSSELFKTPDRDELMKFSEYKKVLNHLIHSIWHRSNISTSGHTDSSVSFKTLASIPQSLKFYFQFSLIFNFR